MLLVYKPIVGWCCLLIDCLHSAPARQTTEFIRALHKLAKQSATTAQWRKILRKPWNGFIFEVEPSRPSYPWMHRKPHLRDALRI